MFLFYNTFFFFNALYREYLEIEGVIFEKC